MTLLASNFENDPIDVLTGDWMSEGNMTVRAGSKMSGNNIKSPTSSGLANLIRQLGSIRTLVS